MPPESLRCKECKTPYPLEARYVCEQCFGPLEVVYASRDACDPEALERRIQAGPHSLWRYGDFLPVQSPPKGTLPAGWTPLLRADRLAEALGLEEVWIKNDAANPTHSFKDRVVSVAMARARELGFTTIACASTGNLANAVAAHAAAAGLESYVFIPSDLEEQKILATGVYGTNLVAVNGNYDVVNRLCTEVSGEYDWAFVNINMRPYYAEGSKTLAYETVEQLGWELPDRVVEQYGESMVAACGVLLLLLASYLNRYDHISHFLFDRLLSDDLTAVVPPALLSLHLALPPISLSLARSSCLQPSWGTLGGGVSLIKPSNSTPSTSTCTGKNACHSSA